MNKAPGTEDEEPEQPPRFQTAAGTTTVDGGPTSPSSRLADAGAGDGEAMISPPPLPPSHPSLFNASPPSSVWRAVLTYWTALRVTIAHLITYETIFVSLTSAGSVVMYTYMTPGGGEPLVAKITLNFMTFIIVFPITANIGYAFVRREKALQSIASIKTYVFHIYVAHRDWAFASKECDYSGRNLLTVRRRMNVSDAGGATGENGAAAGKGWRADGGDVSRRHTEEVRAILIRLIRAMRDYLSLPLVNRSRHLYTSSGCRTRAVVLPVQRQCLEDVYEQMQRLTLAVERMKEAGLPGNEAARINQYHSLFMIQWETARFIKGYRTPVGLRAFARLYILVYPFFAGPYYAWVAGAGIDDQTESWPPQANLGFAIALAVFTGVTLQGLFNIEAGMEDPFDEAEGLDNVRLQNVFLEMERMLSMEWAEGVWDDIVMEGVELAGAAFSPTPGPAPKDVPREGLQEAREAIRKDMNPLVCWM